jgi:hypothetical protein
MPAYFIGKRDNWFGTMRAKIRKIDNQFPTARRAMSISENFQPHKIKAAQLLLNNGYAMDHPLGTNSVY